MAPTNSNAEPSSAVTDSGRLPSSAVESLPGTGQYVVVARRYRPQSFQELIGQEHVAKALSNAIATSRVGHAYLFTGARGVGKTSAARILAKALNCVQGPTPSPCNQCDICRSVTLGDDVDVLEIDGASNRGIDEIRQLRQNVNVRPSRARFKIYIIDEVHMLTREAFNALLKTLEEPPEHVKFIFCTTEAAKIPITILSRCQRFDFAGISTGSIVQRLKQIVAAEGVEAEPAALETLARRANGSMRDSQSLLEQLLSFCSGSITLADVHAMLGTADDELLGRLLEHLLARNAAAALEELERALAEGVDPAQLLEQLLGYLRDAMVAAAGGSSAALLYCSSANSAKVIESGRQLGLHTILAALQIVDQTLARLRYSTQARILTELALVRISQLADLEELAALVAQLRDGSAPAGAAPAVRSASSLATAPRIAEETGLPAKKNGKATLVEQASPGASSRAVGLVEDAGDPDDVAAEPTAGLALTDSTALEIWSRTVAKIGGMAATYAREFEQIQVPSAGRMIVRFRPGYGMAKAICEKPEQLARFEQALAEVAGQKVRVEFCVAEEGALPKAEGETAVRPASPHQRLLEIMQHPMLKVAGKLFGAQPLRIEESPKAPGGD